MRHIPDHAHDSKKCEEWEASRDFVGRRVASRRVNARGATRSTVDNTAVLCDWRCPVSLATRSLEALRVYATVVDAHEFSAGVLRRGSV